ncbi:MAG: hypothetical protein MK008_01275 [Bdellovibrionales bacterium]|nr:hypothetical protein [Bdellovibrionales bacterium]
MFFLFQFSHAQNELFQQFESDIEKLTEQVGEYQDSDQATEWQEKYENEELKKLQAKYRKRKVKSACGTCPLNQYVQGLTENRLNKLYKQKKLSKELWNRLKEGMYYFSYDSKKAFNSYHQYEQFLAKKTKNYFMIDESQPRSLLKAQKSQNILVYIYKTHELYVEILYNHSDFAVFRIYQIPEKRLDSPEIIFKKYNFQDPEFNVPTELSFQKLVDYNGKILSFHSDVKVGTGEFLTELDYKLKNIAKGELVFSGTNDNTQTTLRHNLKTGGSSKVSVYLKTYYFEKMTPEQRSKSPVYEGGELRQNYWGLEWQWVFDSK